MPRNMPIHLVPVPSLSAGWVPDRAPDWTDGALCAESGGDGWFPVDQRSEAAPIRICRRCSVRSECLDYALTNEEEYGIWGGLTPRERLVMLDGRRSAQGGPELGELAA